MADAGAYWQLRWALNLPLPQEASDEAIAYWIEKAEVDPWTFTDLQLHLHCLLDAEADPPPVLVEWGLEVAARRRKPSIRRGPKGDRKRDFLIAAAVRMADHFDDVSERAVMREIGKRLNLSYEAVASARRRGLSGKKISA